MREFPAKSKGPAAIDSATPLPGISAEVHKKCTHLPLFVHTTSAAIAPGTQPQMVSKATIRIVPQP